MKKTIAYLFSCSLLFAFAITAFSLNDPPQQVEQIEGKPIMTFKTTMIDLGEVNKGEKREFSFEFTNTGDADLIIDLVSGCECTTTSHSYLPFAPGKSGAIEVIFDSTEKEESEIVDLDVFLQNTDPETGLTIVERVQYKFELVK
ncbi:MAG: DUF1573 domain-containing protein [Bacteroidota bacterium]